MCSCVALGGLLSPLVESHCLYNKGPYKHYFFNFFLVLLLHDNHVQPVCTFISCTFLLILIFKSTVYCHAHFLYFIFCSLYLIPYLFHFIISSVFVFYNICTVHGADLTHISLLVIYSLYNHVCDK